MILGIAFLFSLVALPYVCTVVIAVLLAFLVPATGFAAGVIYDAVYYAPGAGLPIATISGAILTVVAIIIRRFMRSYLIIPPFFS